MNTPRNAKRRTATAQWTGVCANPTCGGPIPREKRQNRYCCQSCAQTVTNAARARSRESRDKTAASVKAAIAKRPKAPKAAPARKRRRSRRLYPPGHPKWRSHVHKVTRPCTPVRPCGHCGRYGPYDGTRYCLGCVEQVRTYRARARFAFDVRDYPLDFPLHLIAEHGWFSPGGRKSGAPANTGGVSLDHMFSVLEGFRRGVDPAIVAHPANCCLMPHRDNNTKKTRCSFTLEELLVRIAEWDARHGAAGGGGRI